MGIEIANLSRIDRRVSTRYADVGASRHADLNAGGVAVLRAR